VDFIAGTSGGLTSELMLGLARFRYQVFVEMLGWQLKTPGDGLELDQFDRPDTLYVIARDECGSVAGSARLLPTTRPYLLGDVFPQLLHGQPAPATNAVWELSRFATVDLSVAGTSVLSQFSSPIAVDLLRAAMRCAAERGAERLITVSPLGIERLLRRYGFRSHRVAPPVLVDGHPIFACLIEIDEPSQQH
jgi:acyl homoserine lactone synthase